MAKLAFAKRIGTKSGKIQYSYFKTIFRLRQARRISAWIEKVVSREGAKISSLSYVFCSDAYLLSINREYLKHDTLTDIITFDFSETKGVVDGEIYISVPRVRENSRDLGIEFETEMRRVIIHGVLHLVGYGDKTGVQKKEMRRMEEECLGRF